MAKQSGLHQIRGKVGEHSYYRQTGISSGLIRSINQGMSERVKTSEEYANTRLNNSEFGAAANVAGLLGKMVTPKFRPMILPFSQSKMAKDILKLARQNSNTWGQRTVSSSQTEQIAAILSAQSKRDYKEFVSVSVQADPSHEFTIHADYTADQATLMSSLGINKITVYASVYNLATGNWNPLAGEMATGYLNRVEFVMPFNGSVVVAGTAGSNNETGDVEAFIPAPNHSGHQIIVFVVLPTRTINDVDHVLQEYCSFTAMPLPAPLP